MEDNASQCLVKLHFWLYQKPETFKTSKYKGFSPPNKKN
jgi:hypothetical protein